MGHCMIIHKINIRQITLKLPNNCIFEYSFVLQFYSNLSILSISFFDISFFEVNMFAPRNFRCRADSWFWRCVLGFTETGYFEDRVYGLTDFCLDFFAFLDIDVDHVISRSKRVDISCCIYWIRFLLSHFYCIWIVSDRLFFCGKHNLLILTNR